MIMSARKNGVCKGDAWLLGAHITCNKAPATQATRAWNWTPLDWQQKWSKHLRTALFDSCSSVYLGGGKKKSTCYFSTVRVLCAKNSGFNWLLNTFSLVLFFFVSGWSRHTIEVSNCCLWDVAGRNHKWSQPYSHDTGSNIGEHFWVSGNSL